MSGRIWIPQPSEAPTPAEVAAYLQQKSWKPLGTKPNWAEYSRDEDGEEILLEIPLRASAADYPRATAILLEDLGRLENRPQAEILRDMKSAATDIVRLALDGSATRDGRIPVEAGRRVYGAARDLLLAAACSVLDPRPVFAGRKPEEAMSLLGRARFGQTEVGSFVLTLECSVPPRLQQSLLPEDGDPEAPLARKTCVRLAQGLAAAESASGESAALRDLEPFRLRAGEGVSANLLDAVSDMIEAAGAETLRASFSFASGRPLTNKVPREAAFTAETSAILREAANRLRAEAIYPASEIYGTVVKLDSENPSAGGEAVVRASWEGRMRKIRVPLSAADYPLAIQAHADRNLVRCTGDLEREGAVWVLRYARDFAILSDLDDLAL